MANYAMAIDLNKCIGCYNCQIACKDEHVGNDFPPVAKAQPTFGHFWLSISEKEQIWSPSHIKVTYIPQPCQHCDDAPCMKAAKNGAICLDQVDRSLQKIACQLRESSRSAVILIREILHLWSGNLAPAPDPEATKCAFPVVNDDWFSRRRGNVNGGFHAHRYRSIRHSPPAPAIESDLMSSK